MYSGTGHGGVGVGDGVGIGNEVGDGVGIGNEVGDGVGIGNEVGDGVGIEIGTELVEALPATDPHTVGIRPYNTHQRHCINSRSA